jgi:hypothetical protein
MGSHVQAWIEGPAEVLPRASGAAASEQDLALGHDDDVA